MAPDVAGAQGETGHQLHCIFHSNRRNHQAQIHQIKMKRTQKLTDRILAVMLISSLAACGQSSQQAQVEEPAAAEPAEPAMSQSAPAEDRFANMFVTEVTESFNPGVQIGTQFPAIRAMYQGEEITTIDRFIRDKGMIFIAMRSVDW